MAPPRSSYAPLSGTMVHQLEVKPILDALETHEKRHAHHMARAAKHGSRIILRQILPEELDAFLEYATTFLYNMGNFYFLHMLLGYPGNNAQSEYYPGAGLIFQAEIAKVSDIMDKHSIGPENTRIRKLAEDGNPIYHLLQGSSETGDPNQPQELASGIFLVKYASNSNQLQALTHYIESFRTRSMIVFQESQKAWVKDVTMRVENVIGFVEPYRDPAGIRSDGRSINSSTAMIRQLPWALEGVNDGKEPFEKGNFESPDFTCLHIWSPQSPR
ncbi:peptidase family M49-domain-containing protein [Schizothecium vesticola]|uniref:Peptidase family M49-domain-containing protein n=1 Tax=Schizothecium vesticola TaxID=314040 RepID=A0AA40F335_9PEZI|nr:peptidase family M49-domain-containing protein [Schizothecium vesticola]